MKQCKNGHYYDEKKSKKCPYCQGAGSAAPFAGAANAGYTPTIPVMGDMAIPPVMGGEANQGCSPTIPVDSVPEQRAGGAAHNRNMSPTVRVNEVIDEETGEAFYPVCAWLVIAGGKRMGTCFNIHTGENTVGRGEQFDIDLYFDTKVSSQGCTAVIIYDPMDHSYTLEKTAPVGKGGNSIYCNGTRVSQSSAVTLSDYDAIKIGDETYIFRSFCGENFSYEENDGSED